MQRRHQSAARMGDYIQRSINQSIVSHDAEELQHGTSKCNYRPTVGYSIRALDHPLVTRYSLLAQVTVVAVSGPKCCHIVTSTKPVDQSLGQVRTCVGAWMV